MEGRIGGLSELNSHSSRAQMPFIFKTSLFTSGNESFHRDIGSRLCWPPAANAGPVDDELRRAHVLESVGYKILTGIVALYGHGTLEAFHHRVILLTRNGISLIHHVI
jgi:hypothetical protein